MCGSFRVHHRTASNETNGRRGHVLEYCTRCTSNSLHRFIDYRGKISFLHGRSKATGLSVVFIQLEVALSRPLKHPADHFKCRFTYHNPNEIVIYTDGVPVDTSNILKCSPPKLQQLNRGKPRIHPSLAHLHRASRCSCLRGDSIDLSRQNKSHIWLLQSFDDQLLPFDIVLIVHGLR